ncbi:hypothetical protein Q4603_10170 [Zobellia galactanivorans]|uniref:hypothetical protein n=1 Tax=Zobellia galactanivorans (strain DSM 12802 / CCUG 47099 / CIP 106680 / NCIMB 13871 / Dsij) TaxID=63186 RepID=UPI0026E3DA0F|nr:hypothetical protein [Zobellia galactanivorans]MDO6808980.1 hypothetical protein [Zobellia galactanivorans]
MDNFEKHIRENRAAFDDHKADRAKLWANIEAELAPSKPKTVPLWKSPILRIAASVLIILGVSGLIGLSFLNGSTEENSFVSKELQDIDMHYKGLVAYQVQLVQKNEQLSEADKAEFLSFMDELDAEYDTLKLEMQNNLDNELVLEAIVSNYRKRIELIEKLLHQLNESKLKDDDYGYTL